MVRWFAVLAFLLLAGCAQPPAGSPSVPDSTGGSFTESPFNTTTVPPGTTAAAPGTTTSAATPGPRTLVPGDCRDPPQRETRTSTNQPYGRDWSLERLWVNVTADGPFAVEVPLPTLPRGTHAEEWLANARLPAGWSWEPGTTQRSPLFRLTGSGSGSVDSCSLLWAPIDPGCCAEAYLDAQWSNMGDRPEALGVAVIVGTVDVQVAYRASSNLCGAWADFEGDGLAAGWHELPGEAMAVCT
jgi:hypothetical protein